MKKIKGFVNKNYKVVISFILGMIVCIGIGVSAVATKDITYDNSKSGLTSTNLQGAIDELGDKSKACKVATGTGKSAGNIITCGSEPFFVMSYSSSVTTMLAMYKLDVGYDYDTTTSTETLRYGASGIQSSYCSDDSKNCVILNNGSAVLSSNDKVKTALSNYQTYIRNRKGLESATVKLLSKSNLEAFGCSITESSVSERYTLSGSCTSSGYSWLYSSTSLINNGTDDASYLPFVIDTNGYIGSMTGPETGVRPVVTIPSSQIKY